VTLSLAPRNPTVTHSVSFKCPPPALPDSKTGKRYIPLRTGSWTLRITVFHWPLQAGMDSIRLASDRLGNIQAVRASRVEIHLVQDQNVSICAEDGLSGV
jgi:hypothetical protein